MTQLLTYKRTPRYSSKSGIRKVKRSGMQFQNRNVVDLEAENSAQQSASRNAERPAFKESRTEGSLPEGENLETRVLESPEHQKTLLTSNTHAPIQVISDDPCKSHLKVEIDLASSTKCSRNGLRSRACMLKDNPGCAEDNLGKTSLVQNVSGGFSGQAESSSGFLGTRFEQEHSCASSSAREGVPSKQQDVIGDVAGPGFVTAGQLLGVSSSEQGQGRAASKRKASSINDSARSAQRSRVLIPTRSQRSMRSKHLSAGAGTSRPIDVDALESPKSICLEDDQESQKARQIEHDAMLAKILQDELSSEAGFNDDDAYLATMLQDEENARQSTETSNPVSSSSSANVSALQAVRRQMQRFMPSINSVSARSPSVSTRSRLIRNMQNRSHNQQRRGYRLGGRDSNIDGSHLHFPDGVDLDTRLDILAVLESALQGTSPLLEQVDRDFNEGDYEMLLALDDANTRRNGASVDRIEQLPVSVIQPSDVYEEICSICLETPIVNEIVRRLPCMHGFHQQCIDVWLEQQANCPICKVSI